LPLAQLMFIAYWKIFDYTATRRLGADGAKFIVFAGKLLVVVVSEALAYFALCHSTVNFCRGRGRYAGDFRHSGNGARYTCRSKDLISFAAPPCQREWNAITQPGRNGRSDPLRGCTDIPLFPQRILRRA